MKVFFVFALYAVVVYAIPTNSDFDRQHENHAKECIRELNLDPDLFYKGDSENKRLSAQDESCFTACLDKKLGVMMQDGSYDMSAILHITSPERVQEVEAKVGSLIEACKTNVGNDHCRLAACVHRMPERYWKS